MAKWHEEHIPCLTFLLDVNYFRVDGKVSCLGLGPTTPGEITTLGALRSICFQKVNSGIVKAALPADDFLPIKWADAPTEPPPDDTPAEQNAREVSNRFITRGELKKFDLVMDVQPKVLTNTL